MYSFQFARVCGEHLGLSPIKRGNFVSFSSRERTAVFCSETWLLPGGVGLKCFVPHYNRWQKGFKIIQRNKKTPLMSLWSPHAQESDGSLEIVSYQLTG